MCGAPVRWNVAPRGVTPHFTLQEAEECGLTAETYPDVRVGSSVYSGFGGGEGVGKVGIWRMGGKGMEDRGSREEMFGVCGGRGWSLL